MADSKPNAASEPARDAEPPSADPHQRMRRAIRAVTASQLLVANSKAGRQQRETDRAARHSGGALTAHGDATQRLGNQPSADAALLELRSAVEAYVRARRAAGEMPEHVLVSIKTALAIVPVEDAAYGGRRTFVDEVVRWFIEEYFRRA